MTAIFQGELPAGTRLIAKKLADRLGVSATPIREALVALEQVGVIQLFHNRGALVKPFGRQQVRDIFHVRCILEQEAARCACGRIDQGELAKVRLEVESVLNLPTDGDGVWWPKWMNLDLAFHRLIADRCGNERLADEIRRYDLLAQTMLELMADQRETHRAAMVAHLAIIDALLAGDAPVAGQAMAAHIDVLGSAAEEAVLKRR